MSAPDFNLSEVTRLANEIASYSSMADAFRKSGDHGNHRGATSTCISGFLQLADELNLEVKEISP